MYVDVQSRSSSTARVGVPARRRAGRRGIGSPGVRRNARGMGAITQAQILSGSAAAASSSVAALAAAGAIAGPVGLAISAGIALASLAINAIMNSGCGQTCIVSTGFANQANAALQQNIEAFFAPRISGGNYDPTIPLTLSSQMAALANFDALWAWLQAPQQCGNPALAAPGQRCITDRQAGACTWRQPASSVPPWGTPPAGSCWNWFNGYRDPIANATNIYDDTVQAASTAVTDAGSTAASTLENLLPSVAGLPAWAIPAGLLGLVLLMVLL